MGNLGKFWSLTSREKKMFCEAAILLLLCQSIIKIIPFRHIYKFLYAYSYRFARGTLRFVETTLIVNQSLSRAAKVLPWVGGCLSRSIAGFIMLRRRGIPAEMFAGAKLEASSILSAHAWVRVGRGVIKASAENAPFTALIRIGQHPVDS